MNKLELKLDQDVWTIKHGWCKVGRLTRATVTAGGKTYFLDGTAYGSDKNPSLFLENPLDADDSAPIELKEGKVYMFTDEKDGRWVAGVYGGYDDESAIPYITDSEDYIHIRELNAKERGDDE